MRDTTAHHAFLPLQWRQVLAGRGRRQCHNAGKSSDGEGRKETEEEQEK